MVSFPLPTRTSDVFLLLIHLFLLLLLLLLRQSRFFLDRTVSSVVSRRHDFVPLIQAVDEGKERRKGRKRLKTRTPVHV